MREEIKEALKMTVYEALNERYNEESNLTVTPFMYVTLGCNR